MYIFRSSKKKQWVCTNGHSMDDTRKYNVAEVYQCYKYHITHLPSMLHIY